jgi:AraC-like DNA-binding protein
MVLGKPMDDEASLRQAGEADDNGGGGLHKGGLLGFLKEIAMRARREFQLDAGKLRQIGPQRVELFRKGTLTDGDFVTEYEISAFFYLFILRIFRSNLTWTIIGNIPKTSHCLERLVFRKGYRVSEVCAALGCSNRYLHTVFNRDIGMPPKRWMNLERMVVARRKLEGGKTPEEVSNDLGFMSVHTFHRQFHRYYHTTPGRFQRERRIFDPLGGYIPAFARRRE